MSGRTRGAATLSAWLALLVTTIALVAGMGGGDLAAPPLHRPGTLGGWLDERGAVPVTFAVLRLVVLALAWYLLAATVVAVGARLARWQGLRAAADVLTLPAVRRLVEGALGASLTAAVLTADLAGAALGPTARPAAADAGPSPSVPVMRPLGGSPDVPRMHRLPDVAPAPAPSPTAAPAPTPAAPSPTAPSPTAPSPAAPSATPAPSPTAGPDAGPAGWTVAPGDHLWRVAEEVLRRAWGRAPADREITPFWVEVVEANRSRLPDPTNPDLLFPGAELTVPPPPAPKA